MKKCMFETCLTLFAAFCELLFCIIVCIHVYPPNKLLAIWLMFTSIYIIRLNLLENLGGG